MSNPNNFPTRLLIWAVPVIVAIILHEVMHGFVARLFGDDTAARAGRLTLNPIRHIDPFGTLIMPGVLLFLGLPVFGYAKPVPVNFGRLRSLRIGMILVAAAGPLTNLAIATASAIALRAIIASIATETATTHLVTLMLVASVEVNVILAVFNLIPLLPLDGGRVLVGILPPRLAAGYARCERYGFPLLFLLLYMNWLGPVVNPPINAIVRALL